MNTKAITRHIGIGMLAFCATFAQSSMFAVSHFGGTANAQSIQAGANPTDSAYARLQASNARQQAGKRGA